MYALFKARLGFSRLLLKGYSFFITHSTTFDYTSMYSKHEVRVKDDVLEPVDKAFDNESGGRYKNFLYKGKRKPDIRIEVKIN